MEIFLVALYCVQNILISSLAVNSVMFHFSRFIIIEVPAALFEHDYGAISKVHVYRWVSVCINGDTELAGHCVK